MKSVKILVGPLAVVALLLGVWASRDRGAKSDAAADTDAETNARAPDLQILELGPQARRNLRLKSAPARPTSYWRTITIPGMVEDRPGISDRGVTSPAVGSVAEIHVYPGDTVRPGEAIVSISLFSEYLQATQTQLFKAHQETLLLEQEVDRLSAVASAGGIAGAKLIQLENDRQRQQTLIKSARQELLNRGLSPGQVDQVVEGSFVSTIQVVAPPSRTVKQLFEYAEVKPVKDDETARNQRDVSIAYEVQSLAVELGQTVQAGQLIAGLANHEHLYVVGHAFKREAGLLEQAAQDERELEIEFSDDDVSRWSSIVQSFQIRHLSNSIDVESRTFDFFVPLKNQSRSYVKEDETFLVWRYRPGQRARIQIPIENLENVFVLPAEAAARAGPEAFVYRQNGDLFHQISVNILFEDRDSIVIANDGSITPGTYLAQNAGASLRRVLRSQGASGKRPDVHVHADGTVHAAH